MGDTDSTDQEEEAARAQVDLTDQEVVAARAQVDFIMSGGSKPRLDSLAGAVLFPLFGAL